MTASARSVEFLFDFGSPNAFLCHRVIPKIEARSGARFDYVPILLGGVFKATGNQSPFYANAGIDNKIAYQQLEMNRFIKAHGVDDFRMNPHFPVNTLGIMRGAVAAQKLGVFARYVDVVYDAMWARGLKMDEPEVIVATLDAAGLDGAALVAASQDPEVKAGLVANTARAVERGCFGSPTFLIGSEIWFGKDRLREVEEALAA
ncbi:MAG: 2-hydroxychromene-2-carboxylate isomerase [Pseudomonadota bacterium]|nr:2-hydroxychromene-2-carboxylate isomerase [Pseudomonadota bacterium]